MFKVVLIGESNTGKTSLLARFADNVLICQYQCTIGIDFKTKTLQLDDRIVKLQIWDTAGQERFRAISKAYYRKANGCLAVFDVTRLESLINLESQITQFKEQAPEAMDNIILVGNKSDLIDTREVTPE